MANLGRPNLWGEGVPASSQQPAESNKTLILAAFGFIPSVSEFSLLRRCLRNTKLPHRWDKPIGVGELSSTRFNLKTRSPTG
jgi:hypothetical protein